jgi:hypothetical protein
MHTPLRSEAIMFTLKGARINLTRDDLALTENIPRLNHTSWQSPSQLLVAQTQKPLQPLQPQQKKNDTVVTHQLNETIKLSHWLTTRLHCFVAVLLVGTLYTPIKVYIGNILLASPYMWLLPTLFEILPIRDEAHMRKWSGVAYIVLFPVWVSNMTYGDNTSLETALAAIVLAMASVFFISNIQKSTWKIIATLLVATLVCGCIVVLPLTIPCIKVLCTCALSAILVNYSIRTVSTTK